MFTKETVFESVAEAKEAITSTLINAGLSYTVYKSDSDRLILKCLNQTCSFHLRASRSRKLGKATIVAYEPHVCPLSTHFDFKGKRSVKYLKKLHVSAILNNRTATTPATIMFNERERRGNKIGYMAAYRIRAAVILEAEGEPSTAFALLPALLRRIEELSEKQSVPHLTKFARDSRTNAFQAIAITPGCNRASFSCLRPFIALDGTFTTGQYPMTLLAATAMDANNQIVLLSFALVPSETAFWWSWFLLHVSDAFNCDGHGINSVDEKYVFISDRDKGLQNAVSDVFPHAFHGMCAWHLSQNVRARFGGKAASFTLQIARAKTEAEYLSLLEQVKAISPAAETYLRATEIDRWVRFAFPHPRFGHITSNIAEVLNHALKDARQLPPIQMIDRIWHWLMDKRYERSTRVQSASLADVPAACFNRRLERGSRFILRRSATNIFQIEDLEGNKFVVNIRGGQWETACECRTYQEYLLPCSHMLAVVKDQIGDPDLWVDRRYTTQRYRWTYEELLYPLNTVGLTPGAADGEVAPPPFRPQKGRPKTKRFQAGQWGAKKRRCGKCGKLGHHTARTCDRMGHEQQPAEPVAVEEVVEEAEIGPVIGEEEADEENHVVDPLPEGRRWYYEPIIDSGDESVVEVLPPRSRRAPRRLGLSE